MGIQKRNKNGLSEYRFFHNKNMEGSLLIGFSNYFDIDPSSEWGLIPTIYRIEGTVVAQEELLRYLFWHVKSPVLAKVKPFECQQLEKFGFSPIDPSHYVWDPTRKEDVESESFNHDKTGI
ncbi:hypothetical protein [Ammoniphilus resinae]|uniref:Uncharacterized protein n=1 Tax=Ammoniphilus resinae TaxID=861532 RepID=A0ABS4GND4_9BACL|nr:hypothetical protein [Ammoniphilus resinae]MBP1931778.1 hypothetical protein [Ammoniphilus resinae]